MTKLVVRIRDKDINDLRRAARRADMEVEKYIAEVVEVWLSRARREEEQGDGEETATTAQALCMAHRA